MQAIKKYYKGATLAVMIIAVGFAVGCDWTTGGSGFSSSRVDVNFSGTYNGNLGGGRAVENTSGGPIVRMVISQQGDAIEVLDNNGSVYRGRIGSVSVVTVPSDDERRGADGQVEGGVFEAGTQLAQAQVSWSGQDNVAARQVEFTGNISVVAVTQIDGTITESGRSDISEGRTETERVDGNRVTVTITEVINVGGALEETEIVIVRDINTGEELSRTTETRRVSSSRSEYILSPQNTQYHLQGTWVEAGGVVAGVSALAAGSAGRIGVEDSGTAATTPAN